MLLESLQCRVEQRLLLTVIESWWIPEYESSKGNTRKAWLLIWNRLRESHSWRGCPFAWDNLCDAVLAAEHSPTIKPDHNYRDQYKQIGVIRLGIGPGRIDQHKMKKRRK